MMQKYDVIIIGAGLGGLICGAYLSKRGKKVLILEKHSRPGGYCSSFKRNGYSFDTSIHYIKLLKNNKSIVNNIIEDLNLSKYVTLKKLDPSDLIITPAGQFFVYSDVKKTIDGIMNVFPDEKMNIKSFFDFLNTNNFAELYAKTRKRTLKDLLDAYFKNQELISVLNCLMMNIGLPMDKVSALKAFYFLREYFFYQSYYPMGGVQNIADSIVKYLRNQGGNIRFSSEVTKIVVKNKKCEGVITSDEFEPSRFVVSNASPDITFNKCVGKSNISKSLHNRLKKMIPSMPAFNVYLGLNRNIKPLYPVNSSLWYFPTNSFSRVFDNLCKGKVIKDDDYLICSFPSTYDNSLAPKYCLSMANYSGAAFKTKRYWESNRNAFAKMVIERSKKIIPNINDCIEVIETSTPHTYFEYTYNKNGACYGLASLENQMSKSFMPQSTEIDNLFMAGHWTTHGVGQGGVSMVAFSGYDLSKLLTRKLSRGSLE